MDDFRRIQRRRCHDGGQMAGCYGCSCCRPIKDLNKFKKVIRKRSRRILKQEDKNRDKD